MGERDRHHLTILMQHHLLVLSAGVWVSFPICSGPMNRNRLNGVMYATNLSLNHRLSQHNTRRNCWNWNSLLCTYSVTMLFTVCLYSLCYSCSSASRIQPQSPPSLFLKKKVFLLCFFHDPIHFFIIPLLHLHTNCMIQQCRQACLQHSYRSQGVSLSLSHIDTWFLQPWGTTIQPKLCEIFFLPVSLSHVTHAPPMLELFSHWGRDCAEWLQMIQRKRKHEMGCIKELPSKGFSWLLHLIALHW